MDGGEESGLLGGRPDSSGKGKAGGMRQQRGRVLVAAFVVGACLGLVAAERLYVAGNREDILSGAAGRKVGLVARPRDGGGGQGAWAAWR